MDQNSENDVYTNQKVLNSFLIRTKCDNILSRTCRKFNLNYPHLTSMTNGIICN